MTEKITGIITKIAQRLMVVLVSLFISGMMLLSSPAIAATITTLNPGNFETEVIKSSKPTVVILTSSIVVDDNPNALEETKKKAESFFGDKYKIAVGIAEQNREAYSRSPLPLIFPPVSTVSIYEKGDSNTRGAFFPIGSDPTRAFESAKDQFENPDN
ncbi:MAG: hypothetical protein V7L01_05060 [Nostoc sp.]|uniref:hypothetical protein n=1 Tax=Nostoc sp. TaxID=1180 RepID=UPI002FF67830